MTRHFITIEQTSDTDLDSIYALARSPFDDETLKGQGVALVFERPSLRTRASSSVAVHELGGFATFFSRTRNQLWMKGETSGNRLAVREILVDCDNDSLVVLAEQEGSATCHEGYRSCFFRRLENGEPVVVQEKSI